MFKHLYSHKDLVTLNINQSFFFFFFLTIYIDNLETIINIYTNNINKFVQILLSSRVMYTLFYVGFKK